MRHCDVENADFPEGEFEHRNGVWYHTPQDGDEHRAEDIESPRESPGKEPPEPAPLDAD